MVCDEYSEFGAYLRGILIQGEARVISKKTEFQKYRKLLCQKFTQHEKKAPIAERDTLIVEVIPQNVESWGL